MRAIARWRARHNPSSVFHEICVLDKSLGNS